MFTDDRQVIKPTDPNAVHVTTEFKNVVDEGFNLGASNSGINSSADQKFSIDGFNFKFGGDHSDTFQGTGASDCYFGAAGNDTLFGAAGDDDLRGDAGNDILDGGPGQDHLVGGAGNDTLYGGANEDSLMGGDGNDTLYAGAGHDMLDGGKGNDVLNGGDGADAYIVSHGSGNDIVTSGFDAGPGAFDHIAFTDIKPDEVKVSDSPRPAGTAMPAFLLAGATGRYFSKACRNRKWPRMISCSMPTMRPWLRSSTTRR
jgi:serralysin